MIRWNHAFKNQINTLQAQTKDKQNTKRTEIQASLNLFLETASGFYLQIFWRRCVTLLSRPNYCRLTTIAAFMLTIYCVLSVIYQVASVFHTTDAFTESLCAEYKAGTIVGKLCKDICLYRNLSLAPFHVWPNGYRPLSLGDSVIKLPYDYFVGKDLYATPTKGSSLKQFLLMVDGLLEKKLGPGDHSQLLQYITDMANVNGNVELSLEEARTIWSLLQQRHFFVSVVLHAKPYIPAVLDFCGAVYRSQRVAHTGLYRPGDSPFKAYRSWSHSLPPWKSRAMVVMGLLEFTFDVYGAFYMCTIDSGNIGYMKAYDVKLLDMTQLLTLSDLEGVISGKPCATSTDCVYTPHCTTTCDASTHTCSAQLERPNLHLVCRIVGPYIVSGAPHHFRSSLQRILSHCSQLGANLTSIDLHHSLVLNDFMSLMWEAIQ